MSTDKQAIILGSGPGGLAAVLEAKRQGLEPVLISPEEIGGNALWHSLVPSKALIYAARHIRQAEQLGAVWDSSHWPEIMRRQEQTIKQLAQYSQSLLENVTYINDSARMIPGQSHTVAVETASGDRYESDLLI
ncbi:MAG: FAD-dependent oxidoreductase, partial [Firmicutes bacterium]|nr:FAD-dependent oxidoreductase [Bacillota bacterium]